MANMVFTNWDKAEATWELNKEKRQQNPHGPSWTRLITKPVAPRGTVVEASLATSSVSDPGIKQRHVLKSQRSLAEPSEYEAGPLALAEGAEAM